MTKRLLAAIFLLFIITKAEGQFLMDMIDTSKDVAKAFFRCTKITIIYALATIYNRSFSWQAQKDRAATKEVISLT